MLTDEQLAAIAKRAELATPGPWSAEPRASDGFVDNFLGAEIVGPPDAQRGQFARITDALFIAHAREDVPALLAYVADLRQGLQEERFAVEALGGSLRVAVVERADLRRQLAECREAERQRTDLDAIRRAADAILDGLDPAAFNEPINWGDLGAVCAMQCVDERGHRWVRVEIEEAAPGCEKLCVAVADGLAAQGWPDVEVMTEW